MTAYATDMYRQVGVCIGRIIKGAKPGDLPVAQRPNSNLIRQGRGPQWALATLLVIAGEQVFSQDPALEDAARACRCQCRAASNFAA
jgi:hypothetical protein